MNSAAIALVCAVALLTGCASPSTSASPSPSARASPAAAPAATPTALPSATPAASPSPDLPVDAIAFHSDPDGADDFFLVGADGSGLRQLTDGAETIAFPYWSPDGSHIAYLCCSGARAGLYVMDADGANQRQLVEPPVGEPAWSADGQSLLYADYTDHGVWSVALADGTPTPLLDAAAGPELSADGARIVFFSNRDSAGEDQRNEIYVADADGGNVRRLTDNDTEDVEATWSPDGTEIAFVSTREGKAAVYRMDADGSNQRRISDLADPADSVAWSPDGTRVVFMTYRDGADPLMLGQGNSDIVVWDRSSDSLATVSATAMWEGYPAWSPDGTRIAFSRNDGVDFDLLVADLQGNERELPGPTARAGTANDCCPSWRPARPTFGTDPIDAVFAAAAAHQVVAIGEVHGSSREHSFLRELLQDPRFPELFDDVAVEFGTSVHQDIIDRYVDGEDVPPRELSRVWSETSQQSGVWNNPIYAEFYATVREVNANLPTDRVRVLLGDPPLPDPACAAVQVCLDEVLMQRDANFAGVVETQALSVGHRVLIVAGLFHLVRSQIAEVQSVTDLIETDHPGSTYVVIPHEGDLVALEAVRDIVSDWPAPTLVSLAGTQLGALPAELLHGGGTTVTCDNPPCETPEHEGTLADVADGYLFLGP